MKLKFDPSLQYQQDAVNAVVGAFEGQPFVQTGAMAFQSLQIGGLFQTELGLGSLFQIVLQSPASGSSVANTADDLETKLVRADTLVRGGHPSLHKQGGEVIRDAAERFCKEIRS